MKDIDEDEILKELLNEFIKPNNKTEIVIINYWDYLINKGFNRIHIQEIKITIEDGIEKPKSKKNKE
tara:strand:+ start:626 stop:826 length:201 start_codon:yes stop_codon:yes gene_type:complete